MTLSANSLLPRLLDGIERLGNRLPHPTLLFIYLCGLTLLLSAICAGLDVAATHPLDGRQINAVNLLSGSGLRRVLEQTVSNFTQFAPVGTVLVAILGIGIAEHSGLLRVLLQSIVLRAPARLLTFLVVLAGILSNLAADTGYVVLIPLAALVFKAAGRPPLAGIAAAFAGVSGGYSANLMIGPLDAILAGLSTAAAQLAAPDYRVSASGNYYFILGSTFLIAGVGTWVTEKIVLPRYARDSRPASPPPATSPAERRGLLAVGCLTLATVLLLLWGLIPESGLLRDPDSGSVVHSPFINGIVVIIAVYAGVAGWLFGTVSGSFRNSADAIEGMETSMATMAGYLVLMFFAAQFVAYFNWSQLGIITAIKGAALLKSMNPGTVPLLLGFVLLSALVNLLIGSASAKWALLAPVFVPMLLLAGISPEATQVAYRIGDSSTNIITPLMPYFGVVLAFARRHDRHIGIGTLIATMLPYSLFFLLSWSALLALWVLLGIPLGPGAGIHVG